MGCLIPFNFTYDKVFNQYYLIYIRIYMMNIEIMQAYETLSILVNFIISGAAKNDTLLLVALSF